MLTASTRLGPYEIVAPLGAGGMGEVYRARDTRLGREVAVKVLPEPFANNPDRRARFEREAKAVAQLSHPNILAIHDYGMEGGITYAVMELLEGETLRDRLAKGPLPWREAVEIGAAMAEGLAAAHAKGIVHRDLKPENLFLTADGRVKILDFGLARMTPLPSLGSPSPQSETGAYVPAETDPGRVLGTVGYMSPEQVRSQPADARSDIFSFGCVLYEMVTGQRAFQRETAAETMTAILHDEPPQRTKSGQQVPGELGRIIRQCLAKTPNQRLQSARDLALGLRATGSDPTLSRTDFKSVLPRRHLIVGIVAASLLVGAIVATVFLLTRHGYPPESGPQGGVARSPADEVKAIEAVAVLPFENVGDDPEAEHLSDGIPESIIKSLYEVRSLKVRPFSSVSRYKGRGKDLDLQEVARQLKVQAVLTGKLTQRKDSLSVSVELVDVQDLRGIWIGQYDRKRTEIQKMQEEICKQICEKLGLQLTGEEERRLTKRDTEDAEAYQLYLRGRHFWNRRTEEGFRKAIEYFKRAIDKDQTYALAYAGLADSYILLANYGFVPPTEAMSKAKEFSLKALERDEQLPEAHTVLAFISERYDWNWPDAERRFKRAIELNPNYPRAHLLYALFLADRRRFDDARAESRRAQELDPLSPMASSAVGWVFYSARQYDQAINQLKKTLEIDPYFWIAHDYLGRAYFQKGMYEEAVAAFQKAKTLSPSTPVLIAELGYALARSGKKRQAQIALDELNELSKHRYIPPFMFALVYSALGQNDRTFEWLEKAYKERSGALAYLDGEPMYDGLRSDARVAELLRRVGHADKAAERDQGIHSVAVLPFENKGGDSKSEFLCNGVADQIFECLGKLRRRDLKIRSLTSASRFKERKTDVPTIGRELDVEVIVTGTLKKLDDDLSITVEIVVAREDNQIWFHKYLGKVGGILDLQDQIARDVATNLRLQLTGEEEHRLTQRHTEDPEAYLLYREGVYHWYKFTEESLTTAIEYFERALKKDRNYALAYVGLARAHMVLGQLYRGPRQTHPKARELLLHALKIDSRLPEARAGLVPVYLFLDWDWPAAEQELKRALEFDSSLPIRNVYGFYLAAMGRLPEALANIQRAQELDPLAAPRRNEIAQCYNWMGQYDLAITEARKALDLNPNFFLAHGELGLAFTQKSMHKDALQELHTAVDLGKRHPRMRGLLGYAYVRAGQKDEARKLLQELKGPNRRYGCAFACARIHAALGEKDEAFKCLQEACDERDFLVIFLKVDPTLDKLRSDPRFAQILKDMRLPP